jgi:hypothetical protein
VAVDHLFTDDLAVITVGADFVELPVLFLDNLENTVITAGIALSTVISFLFFFSHFPVLSGENDPTGSIMNNANSRSQGKTKNAVWEGISGL